MTAAGRAPLGDPHPNDVDGFRSSYRYDLPPSSIAQEPAPERHGSRLMVLDRRTGRIEHARALDLPERLSSADLLVVNDSRVIKARLLFKKTRTGGRVEILLIRELPDRTWLAMARGAARLRRAEVLVPAAGEFTAEVLESPAPGRIRVRFESVLPVPEILSRFGQAPLPPYIKRPLGSGPTTADEERYQTVYATNPGSIAAPTAGLHFSAELLARLDAARIKTARVTLHVGPGTFVPVAADRLADHVMEDEVFSVTRDDLAAIEDARAGGRRIVAVGTTTVRTLESAFPLSGPPDRDLHGATRLFIRPGFRFRTVGALLTNFHLPESTLLMLVSAFAGRTTVLDAYRTAVREGYRFYSYGDAMLIV